MSFLRAASPSDELRRGERIPEAVHVALVVRHALRHEKVGVELVVMVQKRCAGYRVR